MPVVTIGDVRRLALSLPRTEEKALSLLAALASLLRGGRYAPGAAAR